MKVVILAGGLGTRLSEETVLRPKPMVEIGGMPILWHIMSIYAAYGYKDFVIAAGYKSEFIKDYFANFYLRSSDVVVDLKSGKVELVRSKVPDWRVEVVDTGINTQTGGRIKRLKEYLGSKPFLMTYGDGVGPVNIAELVKTHQRRAAVATLTAVRPPARFGGLTFDGDQIVNFSEKPQIGEGWINGGFMVFEPAIFDHIPGDEAVLERGPLESVARAGKLFAYRHEGFWQPMDTLREKGFLEELWQSGKAPWKVW